MHESPEYRDRDAFSPIFVVAAANSYSSVTTAMLGSHPQLYWFPELRLFNAHTLGEALDTFGSPRDRLGDAIDPGGELEDVPVNESDRLRMSGIVRSAAQLYFGSQSAGDVARAWEWVREHREMSTAEFFDRLLEKVAPRTGIEKSPDTAASETHLMLCRESYPRARFVHLVRHPISSTESLRGRMVDAYQSANLGERSPMELYRRAARIWFSVNQRISTFTSSLAESQVFRMRAEDLLTDSHRFARIFCEWAGLSADESSLTAMLHPEASPFAHAGPSNAEGGEHQKFLADPVPRPIPEVDKVVVPAEWGLNSNEAKGIVELAAELGYD